MSVLRYKSALPVAIVLLLVLLLAVLPHNWRRVTTLGPTSAPAPAATAKAAHHGAFLLPVVPLRQISSAAVHSFADAVAELQNHPRRHMAAGDRALAVGQTDLAVTCYRRAVELSGEDPEALKGLAVALVANQQIEEAVSIYRKLVAIEPQNVETAFNLGVALSQLGYYSQAEEAYQNLLRDHPNYFRAQYNLAVLYQVQGKLQDARDAWARMLEHPERLERADAASAWFAYGETLLDLDAGPDAMNAFARVTDLQPDNADAWMNLSTAARLSGSIGRAAVAAKRAAKLAPFDAKVWARIGEIWLAIYQLTGKESDLNEALDAWTIGLHLDPSQPQLKKYLQIYGKPAAKSQPK